MMMKMMIIHEEIGINIKHIVHVKTRDVQHDINGAVAHIYTANRSPSIHAAQPSFKLCEFLRRDEIALRNQNAVSKAHLITSSSFIVKRLRSVLSIDHRHDTIEAEERRNRIVHEEGLRNGTWIRNPRCFKHDIVEINFSLITLQPQFGQDARKIAADGATDAAIVHGNDLLVIFRNQQIIVHVLRSELIFNNRNLMIVIFLQDTVKQRSFAGTKEPREDGYRNLRLLRFFNVHFQNPPDQGLTASRNPLRYSPSGQVISNG